MKKIILLILMALSISQVNHPYPPLDLVSIPTSGTLPKGTFTIETLLTKNGGMVPKLLVGLNDNFSIGMSFGIQNFIGENKPETNKETPEVQVKYRIFEETQSTPAFLIGLDTQGYGPYIENASFVSIDDAGDTQQLTKKINRYEQKAWGIYAVLSKNWNLLGNLGFHIGLNKNTFEINDNDSDLNLFFGIDKELNRSFSLLLEYNAAINDGNEYTYVDDQIINNITVGKGLGFLNAGLRWNIAQNLLIEINLKDINLNEDDFANREIKIMYSERF